jgi:hypothetical protein
MRLRNFVIAAALCFAGTAPAQTPANQLPQAPAAHHQTASSAQTPKAESQSTPAAATKVDPSKEAAIRHLMDITETSKLGDSMAAYISGQVRRFMGQSMDAAALPKFMDTFNQKFAESAPSKNVTDAMVPIYDLAFSKEEIDQLVQFYESPLGKRLVKALPQVLEDSQNAAEKMDQEAALNVLRGMSKDYPQLKNVLPESNQAAPAGNAAPQTPQPAPAAPQK